MCLFDHVLYCKDIAVIRILSSGLNHAGNLASSPVVFRFCTVSIFFVITVCTFFSVCFCDRDKNKSTKWLMANFAFPLRIKSNVCFGRSYPITQASVEFLTVFGWDAAAEGLLVTSESRRWMVTPSNSIKLAEKWKAVRYVE